MVDSTGLGTHFAWPNAGAELGVANVDDVWPNAGGADVAGVPKLENPGKAVAIRIMNKSKH